jgi:hypothetical protein
MTATWPKITFDGVVAIYPFASAVELGLEVLVTTTNMVVKAQGEYGYTVNTTKLCVTTLKATSSSVSLQSVSALVGPTGSPTTPVAKITNKINNQIEALNNSGNITASLNESFAEVDGKCKTIGTSAPPRNPAPPRSPRVSG